MKIVVASRNPAKITAVREAFGHHFDPDVIELVPVSVPSGVADQPVSDDETRAGARHRAENARDAERDAEFWVGLEGGIQEFDGQLMAFAWMAVLDRDGRLGEARSVTLPLPPAIKRLVDGGMELRDANDRVFGTVNSKHEGGAFALLTGGRYTREGV